MGSPISRTSPLSFDAHTGGRERTALQGTQGVRFARWPVGFFLDWHNAPRRQYVIILSGQVEVGVEEETKLLKAGDVGVPGVTGGKFTVPILEIDSAYFATSIDE
jgi:hypothetical protein